MSKQLQISTLEKVISSMEEDLGRLKGVLAALRSGGDVNKCSFAACKNAPQKEGLCLAHSQKETTYQRKNSPLQWKKTIVEDPMESDLDASGSINTDE